MQIQLKNFLKMKSKKTIKKLSKNNNQQFTLNFVFLDEIDVELSIAKCLPINNENIFFQKRSFFYTFVKINLTFEFINYANK